MSDSNRHRIDEELVARFFSRETSEEENELILQWRGADAANQRQFDTWRLVWTDTGRIGSWDEGASYDVEAALDKVRARRDELLQAESESSSTMAWVWRIAAMLVVGVGISWFIFSGRQADVQEFVAAADVVVSELADGSVVSLNQGSRAVVNIGQDERREVFLEGEAYFEVKPDPDRPFVVKTQRVTVEVLGTSFNVSESEATRTVVSVEEGRVRLSSAGEELILVGGQTGSFDHETGVLLLLTSEDTGEHRFWKTRKLVFREQTLSEVVAILNRAYDQEISLGNEEIGTCQLTVSFDNESIENILEIITITLGLEVIVDGNEIVINGDGC